MLKTLSGEIEAREIGDTSRKKIQITLFADDMIFYVRDLKDSTRKLVEISTV